MRGTGRHRRTASWTASSVAGLAVALVAAGALLWRDPTGPPVPAGLLTVARAWPGAVVVDSPGSLADGTPYTPLHHLDASTSVGTAKDGASIRLVLRTGTDARPKELHRLPESRNPQFSGFVSAGDDLVWAESTTDDKGYGRTRLWRAAWRTGGSAALVTEDVGDAVFFNSQYDLVFADGQVHWVAAAATKNPVTEVRSVPLGGGPVSVRRHPGAFALAGWPWLVSAGGGQAGTVELVNLADGRTTAVRTQPSELVTCSATWCRVLVIAGNVGPARIELMRPDGTDRRTVTSGLVSASISDVAVLDRFEVLTLSGREGAATASQQLRLYDAESRRTVAVADGAGMVLCRGGILWWSTGDSEALTWHTLDLRKLS